MTKAGKTLLTGKLPIHSVEKLHQQSQSASFVSVSRRDCGDLHGSLPLTTSPGLPVFPLPREDGSKQQAARSQTAGL